MVCLRPNLAKRLNRKILKCCIKKEMFTLGNTLAENIIIRKVFFLDMQNVKALKFEEMFLVGLHAVIS